MTPQEDRYVKKIGNTRRWLMASLCICIALILVLIYAIVRIILEM